MNKLVSRSLEILGQATKEIGQDYTSNLTSFINDAKDVKNSIVKSTTDASDTFAKLKATNITKKISDWFYNEENSYDASSGDDFDAGFKIDSNEEPKLDGEKTTSGLTLESMTNITEKQTNAMIKIGRRQAEQSVANTAEIVSVLNNRTSEMITSMNNINKSLIGISDRLDKLIKLQTVEIEESKAEDKSGIYDSTGNLSLKRIFDQAKQNASNNSAIQTASIFAQMLTNGGGPVDVAKFLMGFGTGKKLDVLGGNSIDDMGKKFNEAVGTAIQTGLGNLIKSSGFKTLFGDLTQFEGNKDYSTIAANTYNTKKALFDGMTRMSIVNIIPEYLSKINEALSGESYHVDQRGRLVKGARKNKFDEVTKNAFASTGLTDTAHKGITTSAKKILGDKLNVADINTASQALTGAIVMYLYTQGTTFSASELKGDMTPYIMSAVKTLCLVKNDPQYWSSLCQSIVLQLSSGMMNSAKFVQNVNSSLKNMMSSAESFAKSGKPEAIQAGVITYDMFASQFVKTNAPNGKPDIKTDNTPKPQPTTDDASLKVKRNDNFYLDGKHSQGDFIRGIFGILNRGINVKVLSQKNPSWKFEDYDLGRQSVKQQISDGKFGALIGAAMSSGGSDEKIFKKAVTDGIQQTIGGLAGGEGITGAVKSAGGGFLSNMLGMLGAASMRDLGAKFINGDFKGFFKEGGKGRELIDKAKGEITGETHNLRQKVSEAIPGSIKYDSRYDAAKANISEKAHSAIDTIKETGGKIRDKISGKLSGNERFQNLKNTGSRLANNAIYNKDEKILKGAQDAVDNFTLTPEQVEDADDRVGVELAIQCIKSDDLDGAKEIITCIENKQLRQALNHQVKCINKIQEIKAKREKGQAAIEAGETPDIGSVLQESPVGEEDEQSSPFGSIGDKFKEIIDVVGGGFKKVGSVLGKIAKFVGRLATKGVTDIVFGLKSMGEGFFGAKRRDENGEVIKDENGKPIRDSGIIKPLMKPMIGMLKLTGKLVKGTMKAVKGFYKLGAKMFSGIFTKTAEGISKIVNKFKKNKDDSGDEKKPGILKRAGTAFRSTRFGQGFMKGFDDAKKARQKKQNEKARHESYTTERLGDLTDVMTEPVNEAKKTPFVSICDFLGKILKSVDVFHKDVKEAESDDGTPLPVDTGGADMTDTLVTAGAALATGGTSLAATGAVAAEGAAAGAAEGAAAAGGASAAGAAGGAAGGLGALGDLGKIFGGFTQALMGIGELVLSIVMGMEGLQAIKDAVMGILTEGLEPLNDAFGEILEALTPMIEALKGAVTSIAETIVVIVKTLVDVINPIMEAIMDILNPILDLINILLDVIMMPILLTLDFLSPIIEGIGYTMKIMSGALQIGMGIIIGLLGSLLKVVGSALGVLGKVPLVGRPLKKLGKSIESTADGMLDSSKSMISAGVEQMKEGINGLVSLAKSIVAPADEEEENTSEPESSYDVPDAKLGYDMGSGDVNTTNTNNITNNWSYTYGSGNTTMNQHSYGGYMNMSEHGCGPVALADAYNRRSGGNADPRTLASAMMGSGMYDPRRGSSAGSMVSMGNAMGMNMRPGGVTTTSLKNASPSNPITVLGSGAGFGTKPGNNHYVNVVGTDKNGGVYVSNPMSGRVERQSASNFALNSKLGLYGSGDNEYEQYGFDEETTNMFESLKKLTSQFTGMFQGPSKEDKINKQRSDAKDKQNAETIKQKLSEEEYSALQEQAMAKLKEKYPKEEGESDEDYEARINKKFESEGASYIVQLGAQQYADKMGEFGKLLAAGADEAQEGFETAKQQYGSLSSDQIEAEADAEESFESDKGAIMAPYSPIEYTEPQIEGVSSGKSPVHDFFAKTSGKSVINASTLNGGWFEHSDAPVSKEGVGSQGDPHEGIAISFTQSTSKEGKPEAHAITGGTITYVGTGGKHGGKDPNGGLGNHVKWRDEAGMYHWYLHLADIDNKIKEGANLEPGQLIGHVGDTGDTGERGNSNNELLRYIVTKMGPYGNTGDDGYVNPLTYWKFQEGGNEELTGGTEKEQIFNFLVNSIGLSKKAAAGVMGVFQAESGLSAGTLEGYYAFDADTVKNATKDNSTMDAYTTDNLFPMYYRSGVGISESGYKSNDGHYYPGFGLAQWTGGRGQLLMDYSKENGTDWRDLSTQLGLIKQELTGNYSWILDDLNSYGKDDVVKAADVWMTQYEAGGGKGNRNPSSTMLGRNGGIDTRRNNAQAIYSEMENHVVPASTTVKSDTDSNSIVGRFISSMTNHALGDGYFVSDGGVALADYGIPTITETNISGVPSGNSPLHEFFGKTTDGTVVSGAENWFGKRDNPNSKGEGSSGGGHGGIDLWWSSGATEGQEAHATCSGTVDQVQGGARPKDGSNGGCGNNVRWLDDAGYLHWYMHMRDDPLVSKGDKIEPGQLLGYVGDTGSSGGAHLHYNINKADKFTGSSSDGSQINPLTYFNNYNPSGSNGNSNQGQHRGGFTNAKNKTMYTGMGPYMPDDTSKKITAVNGSGDFWYDALTQAANDNVSTDIPDVDLSKFTDEELGTTSGQTVTKYTIVSDTSRNIDILDKMSKMTFNVRARRVEELLEELIKKVDPTDTTPIPPSTDGYDPDLFDNDNIPDQVLRLAMGN